MPFFFHGPRDTSGAADLVDGFLAQLDDLLVGRLEFVTHQLHQPRPSSSDPQHAVAFPESSDGQSADGGIQAGYVTATG